MGALLLVMMNWPGPAESRRVWYHSDTGWGVYRSWGDPEILASVVALVACVALRSSQRWALLALGVVAGCAASLIEDGFLILGGDIAAGEEGVWVATTAAAAGIAVVLLLVVRPRGFRAWPVNLPAAVLVAAGIVLIFVSAVTQHDDGISFYTVTKLALTEPLVVLALAWLALGAQRSSTRLWLSATITTYVLISIVAAVPALTVGDSMPVFLTALIGNLLVAAGVAVSASRSAPDAMQQQDEAPFSRWLEKNRWLTAAALGIGALVLLLVNEAALSDGQKLWYDTRFGAPKVSRHQADGTLAASIVALLAALFAWRRGRFGAYAIGAAAGAAALFTTAGLVILGSRIAVDNKSWSISLFIAGLMLVPVAAGPGLRTLKYRRPDPATSAVLAVGVILLGIDQLLSDQYGPSAATFTRGFALLIPVVAAALVLIGTTTGDKTLIGAAASYQVLFALAALYPIAMEEAPNYFATALLGHLILLAALLLGVRRLNRGSLLPSHP